MKNIAFKIKYHFRVPRWIIDLHKVFAKWLIDNYTVSHPITVYLLPNISLSTKDRRRYWGSFNARKQKLFIELACGRPKIKGHLPSQDKQITFLLDNFAHEFCHYEHWRDNRAVDHRGLEKRAKAIVDRFHEYVWSQQ